MVGVRGIATGEGGEVIVAWRGSASNRPLEGGEVVSDWDTRGSVAAANVDHRKTLAKDARGHCAVEVGCIAEIA